MKIRAGGNITLQPPRYAIYLPLLMPALMCFFLPLFAVSMALAQHATVKCLVRRAAAAAVKSGETRSFFVQNVVNWFPMIPGEKVSGPPGGCVILLTIC